LIKRVSAASSAYLFSKILIIYIYICSNIIITILAVLGFELKVSQTCYAGTLSLEPCLWSLFALVILQIGSCFLPMPIAILLISASQVARIIGGSRWYSIQTLLLKMEVHCAYCFVTYSFSVTILCDYVSVCVIRVLYTFKLHKILLYGSIIIYLMILYF
jgi:hypothetical protein